ncbi:MAG TPA: DUF1513 domain-containing protein [Afifellaceae bacterium]|nr:DUF1513 domain-containing protein [Afifellaceae bacterium]
MMACPFSDNCPYLDREPELLVVNGYRHWVAGCQTGDAGHWSEAWNLFAVRLGPRAARPVIGQLSSWVKSICLWRTEPLNLFHVGCRYVCRDMRHYIGSVAANAEGTCIAVTSPRGGRAVVLDAANGRIVTSRSMPDVCGAAGDGAGFALSSHSGVLDIGGRTCQPPAIAGWDNHLLRI